MNKPKKINLIMHVSGTLSDFPINIKQYDLEREMWAHVNSKYSSDFNIHVSTEQTLDYGIGCLTNIGESVSITLSGLHSRPYIIPSLKNNYKDTETFIIGKNDLIMFPTNLEYEIHGDGAKFITFSISNKKNFGSGPNQYRVEVVFSDKYHILVNAEDEESAKDMAYDIDTSYWTHEWPNDPELERTQITRVSKWGKKNLKSFKV